MKKDDWIVVEADAFGGVCNTEHGDVFADDEALVAQGLLGVVAAVMLGDHAEAGGAAVHRV